MIPEDETLIDLKYGDEITPEQQRALPGITEYEFTGVPPTPDEERFRRIAVLVPVGAQLLKTITPMSPETNRSDNDQEEGSSQGSRATSSNGGCSDHSSSDRAAWT